MGMQDGYGDQGMAPEGGAGQGQGSEPQFGPFRKELVSNLRALSPEKKQALKEHLTPVLPILYEVFPDELAGVLANIGPRQGQQPAAPSGPKIAPRGGGLMQ